MSRMAFTFKVSENVRTILQKAEKTETSIQLTEQLDRKTYVEVAKVIEAAGGKWDKKAKCHVFSVSAMSELLRVVGGADATKVKQLKQAFYTPKVVADKLVALIDPSEIRPDVTVLEPSVGQGALIEALFSRFCTPDFTETQLTLVDNDEEACKAVRQKWPLARVMCQDFLESGLRVLGSFDLILMNPPFTRGTDVRHVQHALRLLKPGGRLLAICSGGAEDIKQSADAWCPLPQGAFKEAGTNVNTAIAVIVDKRLTVRR
jgi:SAM-dependent methyltransferase